ncbi:unnamed protein product [Pleuronectes platessa]|uniref:Uncharacterized protein n=1 Tax=Pleuronectes platessa TaxID=8262 RepID=A0A9N7UCR0_PLEPL|nr:unnamed protein product [Pleuronectes platessa]
MDEGTTQTCLHPFTLPMLSLHKTRVFSWREAEDRKPGCQTNLAPPTTFEVGKFGLESLRWRETMPGQKLFGPIKLSGRALYDDGQMNNSNVINHVTKEPLS